MKAIVVTGRGGPDVLSLQDVPKPVAKSGEVLVKISAVGLNFADTVQTQGLYPGGPKPPYIAGLEFAGTIEGTSERVMGVTNSGACAEFVAAPRAALWPFPANWTFEEAAAFPVNYLTAYFAYWRAGLLGGRKSASVLIHAAAGGVGTAAIQIGKLLGITMLGTSSSAEKLARAKELGLTHGINYKTEDYESRVAELTDKRGVDAVFEMLGGEHTAKSIRCLAENGQIVIYGLATGEQPKFDFMSMFQKNAGAHALWLTPLVRYPQLMGEALKTTLEWGASGKLRPVVGHTMPLEKAADGFRLMIERKNFGKVVLAV
jgi:NADPH2:quinone reductase